eukprot:g1130.t1
MGKNGISQGSELILLSKSFPCNCMKSGFGTQARSTLRSAPAIGFGTSLRDATQKASPYSPNILTQIILLLQQYVSPAHAKSTSGNYSPGAVYRVYSAIGTQPISEKESSPAFGFGNSPRSARETIGRVPGPGTYKTTKSFGSQADSTRPTSTKTVFGSSTRDDIQKLYMDQDLAKAKYGLESPPPNAYSVPSAIGRQVLSSRRSSPGWGLSNARRFKDGKERIDEFESGKNYQIPRACGPQTESTRKSAPQFSFGETTRDKLQKVLISPEHAKQACGGCSPGPGSGRALSAIGRQHLSYKRSAPGWQFGLACWMVSRTLKKRLPKPKLIARRRVLTVNETDELSVVSFNVLADNLVRANPTYNYASELYRSWEYRWDKLKEEITAMDADIVCLQEIEIDRWDEWRIFMESIGYNGILQRRNKHGQKSPRHQSITNATFFRNARFTSTWEEHKSRALGLGLKWTNSENEEQTVYVINVHLEGHMYRPVERMNQVKSILKVLEQKQGPTANIIFCGDFNSTRWNGPWNYLYKGRLEGGYTESFNPDMEVVRETIVHPYALQDAYKTAGAIPEFTSRAPKRRTEVDFIFCSRHLRVGGVLRSVDPRLVPSVDRTLLPNRLTPSDHLPLGAVLLPPKGSELRGRRKCPLTPVPVTQDHENEDGLTNESVCSDNTNSVEINASANRDNTDVEALDVKTQAQRRFLESCVMPIRR